VSAIEPTLSQLCGQLVVGGFEGRELPRSYARALGRGERGGAILFRRNLGEPDEVAALCQAVARAVPFGPPALVGVDQEGGRVARLGAPFLSLPPMRVLGRIDDEELTARAGAELGRQLAAVGFSVDFAPVLDVDSNPENPVIGDRSFGPEPEAVARHGLAWARGLQSQAVAACGKHFPGHGDTALDSHCDRPVVDRARAELEATELPPFRAASRAGLAALMSAHVVYPALDAAGPATFSPAICTSLLRDELGFEGALFSDDLEMGAIAQQHGMAEAALRAVEAGCDLLLICHRELAQHQAHEALVREAERSQAFRARCQQASERAWRLRQWCLARRSSLGLQDGGESSEPAARARLHEVLGRDAARQLADEIDRRAAKQKGAER